MSQSGAIGASPAGLWMPALLRRSGVRALTCQARPCRHFTLAHRRLRRDGILLGEHWHCSPGCLQKGIQARLAASQISATPTRRYAAQAFRLLLLERTPVTEAQLREAMCLASRDGEPVETILLQRGYLTENSLAGVRAAHAGVSLFTLSPSRIAASAQLPAALMRRSRAAVVHTRADRTLVGFVEHIDSRLLHAVAQVSTTRVEPCFIAASCLAEQLQQAQAQGGNPSVAVKDQGEATRAVVLRAIAEGAEQIEVAGAEDWLWARLFGGAHGDTSVHFWIGKGEEDSQEPSGPVWEPSSVQSGEKRRSL